MYSSVAKENQRRRCTRFSSIQFNCLVIEKLMNNFVPRRWLVRLWAIVSFGRLIFTVSRIVTSAFRYITQVTKPAEVCYLNWEVPLFEILTKITDNAWTCFNTDEHGLSRIATNILTARLHWLLLAIYHWLHLDYTRWSRFAEDSVYCLLSYPN